MPFFIIEYVDEDTMKKVGELLAYYRVLVSFHTNDEGDWDKGAYLKVMPDDTRREDYRLAEGAFQWSFRQKGTLCVVCEALGTEDNVCGHLTFTTFI